MKSMSTTIAQEVRLSSSADSKSNTHQQVQKVCDIQGQDLDNSFESYDVLVTLFKYFFVTWMKAVDKPVQQIYLSHLKPLTSSNMVQKYHMQVFGKARFLPMITPLSIS